MAEVTDLEAVWQLADLRGEQLQQALAERDQARGEAHRDRLRFNTQAQQIGMRNAIIRERDQELARLRAELAALETFARDRSALVAERDEAHAHLETMRQGLVEANARCVRYAMAGGRAIAVVEAAKPLVAHAKQSTAPRTPVFEALIAAVDEWQRAKAEAGGG
jgi:chromosome segregation ATPase